MATVKQMLEYGTNLGMEMSETVHVCRGCRSIFRPFKQYEKFTDAEILAMAKKTLRIRKGLRVIRLDHPFRQSVTLSA
jgi:hypothetical protein